MALSDRTRKRVEQIIKDHHKAFCVEVLGPTVLPKEELERLQSAGILKMPTRAVTGRSMVSVPAAHVMGVIAAQSGENALERMSEETFWNFIAQSPPRLTQSEKEAIQVNREHLGMEIQRLGDDLATEFARACREEGAKVRRTSLVTAVAQAANEGLRKRQSAAAVAKKLEKRFPKLKRDWLMIVTTEMHNQMEEGKAHAFASALPRGTDPLVFKIPLPDACRFCKLLYLDGKRPRVFRLSELIANGSNQGRRARKPTLRGPNATEWRPVLGSVHPWCRCQLRVLMDGFTFDTNGTLVLRKSDQPVVDELNEELIELLKHQCEV